jgi:hypothetical protein
MANAGCGRRRTARDPEHSRFELARYEHLIVNATIVEVDGLHVAVASLADIISSKEIANRPKDRDAL